MYSARPIVPKYALTSENSRTPITAPVYSTRTTRPRIDNSPGMADSSAETTLRMLGSAETSRSARRMRSARSTENVSVTGTSATATITRSNRFHGSRKKSRR